MDRAEYLKRISKHVYQGEVFGEGIFSAFYAAESDPERQRKLANLLQLETETKARLRPFMVHLGLSLTEPDVSSVVKGYAEGYAARSWHEHMQSLLETTAKYIEEFKAIEAHASGYEKRMARIMVAHEESLNVFARMELDGDADRSLDGIIQQLHWPIY